jgi:hypothetical protein
MSSRKRSRKQTGIARPRRGHNRSNRRKDYLAKLAGKDSPVVLPPRRKARKKFGGRADR